MLTKKEEEKYHEEIKANLSRDKRIEKNYDKIIEALNELKKERKSAADSIYNATQHLEDAEADLRNTDYSIDQLENLIL